MSGKKILIIDDEDDIREVAQLGLEMMGGWEVLTAASGEEGITQALAHQPHAILLDVMMPELDGPATFKQLQAHPQTQDIPVVLLTAKVQAADQQRFQKLGVKAILFKPFDPVTLSTELEQLLGW